MKNVNITRKLITEISIKFYGAVVVFPLFYIYSKLILYVYQSSGNEVSQSNSGCEGNDYVRSQSIMTI
jgi:hypothetical protein